MPGVVEITTFFLLSILAILATGFVALYFIDVTQTEHSVRRNYPVIGRLRYFLEYLGKFFRQYFFAMDREELPFNRAERSWVYRAAKDVGHTVAFGSTRDIRYPGTVYFVNCAFPTLDEEAVPTAEVTIGPYAKVPYKTDSFFNVSAMCFGSLSRPAIQALSRGAKMAGIWVNTGEGGISPHHLEGGCDLVVQIGTAKYGLRDKNGKLSNEKLKEVSAYKQVRMFEIKLSQGAKPGNGGILPGVKVTAELAALRGIEDSVDAVSPNRHPEISNISELLDMINHVRDITGRPVGFKTGIGDYGWLEDMCREIAIRGIETAPDFITVDGAEGGTGAGPMSLMDNTGVPIRESLPEVVSILHKHKLRDRIKVIASGKLVNPPEVSWALCAGADFINSARGFMFAMGCVQSMRCNKNTCPTGIATHNKRLQKGLDPQDKSVRVMNYANNMKREIGIIAHSCGVKEPRQFRRRHARIVVESGKSIGLDELYPRDGDEYSDA